MKSTGRHIIVILFLPLLLSVQKGNSQEKNPYPPFTKWYQDPLGLKPLELSSATGFVWGAAAVASCLLFTKKDTGFSKNVSVYQESAWGWGYKPPYTTAWQQEVGLSIDVRKFLTLGMGWNIFSFRDKTNNTMAFGLRPFAKWYPYRGKKFNLFIEYGAGICYAVDRFPLTGTGWQTDTARTGTRFNFISKYGAGLTFHFRERISLASGIRHFHLSNGNIRGIQRNPSHDSNGFFLGLTYVFRRSATATN